MRKSPPRALTTSQMAHYCTVRVETVTRWVREKSLEAHTTAGGRYRIPADVAIRFMRSHGIPIPDELYQAQESKRVLVVDDDSEVLESLVLMLKEVGPSLDIRSETDGIAACIALGSFKPDLLILDLKMPGMDGYALCEKVRADPTTRDAKILVVTGYLNETNQERALDSGADACLSKPIGLDLLAERVHELLGVSAAARR